VSREKSSSSEGLGITGGVRAVFAFGGGVVAEEDRNGVGKRGFVRRGGGVREGGLHGGTLWERGRDTILACSFSFLVRFRYRTQIRK
jgi:hypothetical protein